MVLATQQVHAVARAVLGDHMGLGHRAGHEPRLRAVAAQPGLQHPVQRLAWRDLLPARREGRADGGLVLRRQCSETGQQQHGRERVEHQVLAARVQATAAVEDALRIGREGHPGDGVEQGLHGFFGGQGGRLWLLIRSSRDHPGRAWHGRCCGGPGVYPGHS